MSGRRAKTSPQKVEERWIVIAVYGSARDKGGRTVPFFHIVVHENLVEDLPQQSDETFKSEGDQNKT